MPKLFSLKVKSVLQKVIEDHDVRKAEFVVNPKCDFTRKRKLTFQMMIKATLAFGSGSIGKELLEVFDFGLITPTCSAFIQQRDKLKTSLFKSIFTHFTHAFTHYKTFKGYRLVAIDGSSLHIPHDPKDSKTYIQSTPTVKGYNVLHVNAMYDLLNRVYVDGFIQMGREQHERKALLQMMSTCALEDNVLLIGDRGYESYNIFAHLIQKGWKFLIRVRDHDTGKRNMVNTLGLPHTGEYDQTVQRILTRSNRQEVLTQPERFKIISAKTQFDFFTKENPFFPITFRVVRIQLDDGSYHCFITNLDAKKFSPEIIKDLYHLRWGIETSFRELKHLLALTHLHSKKKEGMVQEIFAKMTMYNFCSIITSHVAIKKKDRKHDYQVNFSKAITICKQFFKEDNTFLHAEALIQKYILPIRKGRTFLRHIKVRSFVSFIHRVA